MNDCMFQQIVRRLVRGHGSAGLLFICSVTLMNLTAIAQERHARVSPVMEIEIVDPRRDARGNPAVDVTRDALGNQQVEIAPSLIVHRYYYTGDRSFRGPDLPGGPSIVVATNPRDGKQVYLPVQMLPGSPVVSYRAHSIDYDFGDHAVVISFPHVGDPVVSYRNGPGLNQRLSKAMGSESIAGGWKKTTAATSRLRDGTKTVFDSIHNVAGGVARPLTLPAQNLGRLLPGGVALSDPDFKARVAEEKALRERDAQVKAAQKANALNNVDIPSLR